jgi:hypothetical protein
VRVNDGGLRTLSVNGPGTVYGGVNQNGTPVNITYTTLTFQPRNTTRFGATKLLDMGVQKVFSFRDGRNRVKLMFDAFNVFNVNTVTGWSSSNLSTINFNSPSNIIPPRVFRLGATVAF